MDGELIRLYWTAVRVDCPRMTPGCLSSSLPELTGSARLHAVVPPEPRPNTKVY